MDETLRFGGGPIKGGRCPVRATAPATHFAMEEGGAAEGDAVRATAPATHFAMEEGAAAEGDAVRATAPATHFAMEEGAAAEGDAVRATAPATHFAMEEGGAAEGDAVRATAPATHFAMEEGGAAEGDAVRATAPATHFAMEEGGAAEGDAVRATAPATHFAMEEGAAAEGDAVRATAPAAHFAMEEGGAAEGDAVRAAMGNGDTAMGDMDAAVVGDRGVTMEKQEHDRRTAAEAAAAAEAEAAARQAQERNEAEAREGGCMERDGMPPGPLLLEIAWEVAWKVGGIYTVLRTKVPFSVRAWGPLYALVGIFNAESAEAEFEAVEPPPLARAAIAELRSRRGAETLFGRWLVPGYPRVFLFRLEACMHRAPQWRSELMPGFEAPHDAECDKAIVFGHHVAWLLEAINRRRRVIAHFHEWQAGMPPRRSLCLPC